MKILNPKTLTRMATGRSFTKQGYLSMKELNESITFHKRFVKLVANVLFYFERQSDEKPQGMIILESHLVDVGEQVDEYHFTFHITFGSAPGGYTFAAGSQGETHEWIEAIVAASCEFALCHEGMLSEQLYNLTVNSNKDLRQQLTSSITSTGSGSSSLSVSNSLPHSGDLRVNPFRSQSSSLNRHLTDAEVSQQFRNKLDRLMKNCIAVESNNVNDFVQFIQS